MSSSHFKMVIQMLEVEVIAEVPKASRVDKVVDGPGMVIKSYME